MDGDEMEGEQSVASYATIIRVIDMNQKVHCDDLECYKFEYKLGRCEVLFVLSTMVLTSK